MKRRVSDKRQAAFNDLAPALRRKVERILQKHQVSKAAHQALVAHFTEIERQYLRRSQTFGKNLGQFLHELRGGLNGILMTTEVLQHDLGVDARFKEALMDLDLMRRSILRTLEMMDEFVKKRGPAKVYSPSPAAGGALTGAGMRTGAAVGGAAADSSNSKRR